MSEQNQPINALPIKTASGVTATDYILGIGSAEEYQMLIQDLGDYIIQNATSSLAGQSQTLASVISGLDSKTYSLSGGTVITNNTDLDTLKTVGNYYAYNVVQIVNGPFNTFSGILKVENSAGQDNAYLRQTIVQYNSNNRYERVLDGTRWSDWELRPTRAEVDALNSKFLERILLPNGGILKIAFDTYSTGALIFSATSNSAPLVYVYSNGYLAPVVMNNNINVALSSDYKTVTITNNTGYTFFIDVISPNGSAEFIDT